MLKNHIHSLFDVKDRPNNSEEKAKHFKLIICHPLTNICMTRNFNHTPIKLVSYLLVLSLFITKFYCKLKLFLVKMINARVHYQSLRYLSGSSVYDLSIKVKTFLNSQLKLTFTSHTCKKKSNSMKVMQRSINAFFLSNKCYINLNKRRNHIREFIASVTYRIYDSKYHNSQGLLRTNDITFFSPNKCCIYVTLLSI